MEMDEATKKRIQLLESEVENIMYNSPEPDGVLCRDSAPIEETRSNSMKKQKAAND